MSISRDDCASAALKTEGVSIVCARVANLSPATVTNNKKLMCIGFGMVVLSIPEAIAAHNFVKIFQDLSGSLVIESFQPGQVDVDELAYFMLDCSHRPPRCTRVTVVPEAFSRVASYQLESYRDYLKKCGNAHASQRVIMGVSWVFETSRNQQVLQEAMEGSGAVRQCNFQVDSMSYRPHDQLQNNLGQLFVLHHSNFPQSAFAVVPQQSFKTSPRSVCDRGFDMILSKLSGGLQMDQSGKFEVNGVELEICDFAIRLGTVTLGGSVKGTIVEIEYKPVMIASQGVHMLTDFMKIYFPEVAERVPEVINKSCPEPYTALDTLYQYQQIFTSMRKKA